MLCCLRKESLDKNKKNLKFWRLHIFFETFLSFVVISKLFFGNFSRVWALSLVSVFARNQSKKIPSANATKQTKVQLKPHPLSLLRALIQESKTKKEKKKKRKKKDLCCPTIPLQKTLLMQCCVTLGVMVCQALSPTDKR